MIKVAPILYTYKTLSNGEHPLMIRLTLKGKRKYIGLGVNCKASYWVEKTLKLTPFRRSKLTPLRRSKLTP